MNIFAIDKDPSVSAQSMCDKHIVKMILEAGQMLSTSHRYLDGELYYEMSKGAKPRKIKRWRLTDEREDILWKATFLHHPCTVWTFETSENYSWHQKHAKALCEEYTYRYGKRHSAENLIDKLEQLPYNIVKGKLTRFAVAMPEEYKVEDAVESYRNYYNGAKSYFAKWTKRDVPAWYTGVFNNADV